MLGRRKHKLNLFYKMMNGLGPDHLNQLIPPQVSQASSYNLGNSKDYLTVCTNTLSLSFHSFLPSVVREWNNLPQSSRSAATLASSKMSLNKQPQYYFIGKRLGQIYRARLRTKSNSLTLVMLNKLRCQAHF